jgi:hypothetical protein
MLQQQKQKTILGKELATTKFDDIATTSVGRGQTIRDSKELSSSSQESHLCSY